VPALSTGQLYLGGGTPIQKACGLEDSPEEMYKYLMASCGPGEDEAKIRLFCNESVEHFHWLVSRIAQAIVGQRLPCNGHTSPQFPRLSKRLLTLLTDRGDVGWFPAVLDAHGLDLAIMRCIEVSGV
jgi:hypothetical protein